MLRLATAALTVVGKFMRSLDLQTTTLSLLGLAPGQGDWTARERRQLNRLRALCATNQGSGVSCGCADEGDPWCIVHDVQGEVMVHIARIGRR